MAFGRQYGILCLGRAGICQSNGIIHCDELWIWPCGRQGQGKEAGKQDVYKRQGVFSVSAHPFTTNLHNQDVRITTNYSDHVDSSIFSVIHEAGHAIYEMGILDDLTQTVVGQGASMGMHESQSRFFENIIGRSRDFWVPVYGKLQEIFPDPFEQIELDQFVEAINQVHPDFIRTEADELTYSLHVLIRYEIEKMLIERCV